MIVDSRADSIVEDHVARSKRIEAESEPYERLDLGPLAEVIAARRPEFSVQANGALAAHRTRREVPIKAPSSEGAPAAEADEWMQVRR
jgi:hypothetical protein